MTAYIAWYGKKRTRLTKLVHEFLDLLLTNTDPARLIEGAEIIRAAQLRALKEKRAQFAPSEKSAAIVDAIDHEIQHWVELSTDEIIAGYRDPIRRHKMSSAVRAKYRGQA